MQTIKKQGLRINLFCVLYLVFISTFFICTEPKWHDNFFYACLLVPYTLTLHHCNFKLFLKSPMFLLVATLLSYLLITPLWGERGTLLEYGRAVVQGLSLLVFLMLTSELSLRYPRFITILITVICWASVIGGGLYIFINYSTITVPYSRFGYGGYFNNLSALRNPIHIGSVYGFIVLIMYFHFIRHGRIPEKIVYAFISLFCLAVLILTYSRGPLLAFYLASIVGILIDNNRKMVFIFICLTAMGWFLLYDNGYLHSVIFRGDSYRIEIFKAAMEKIEKGFFFGNGLFAKFSYPLSNGSGLITGPHNMYLATWIYGGLTGLCLLVVLLARGVWQSINYFVKHDNITPGVWLIYGLICIITGYGSIIDHPHPVYLYLWLPIGILMAFEIRERTEGIN